MGTADAPPTLIPLYGFLEGDSIGLLLLMKGGDTIAELAARLQDAASVRVAPRGNVRVEHRGRTLALDATVAGAGLTALERVDVRRAEATA
jgi:hypothetical protein